MPGADAAAVERALRAFVSEAAGLAAHELNNRLAVMRETVGLLEDLARAGKSGAAGTARAHASLDDQVGRALDVVRTISGIGRALVAPGTGFDAGAAKSPLLRCSCQRYRRCATPFVQQFRAEPACQLAVDHVVIGSRRRGHVGEFSRRM
jgi:hypothetical protein